AIHRNKFNYELYRSELENIPGLKIISFPRVERNNYQYVILELDHGITGITRDLLLRVLAAEQVGAKPYFSPACHQLEPYASENHRPLPHTERLASRVLALPTGTGTGAEDIRRVSNIIHLAVTQGTNVSARWGHSQAAPSPPTGGTA
ncbi:MAG: DegT/DnrJ/EryC1/StrS family aminotransferase, partial [Angustibacter sp.]